ncbi:MAG: hypothetical protein O3B31_01490 [Chloroflexi bacterium]|nr:hypothetical protein [Chloroflexota bacterium]MDA1002014.1 hypothetical protein [Chloroflexota bacterium]
MTTSALSHDTIEAGRALERVRAALPARSTGRALALRAAQQAMPIVARSVAAGMAVIAVEQALRRFADGASARMLPVRRVEPAPRPYMATLSVTETVVIERMRRRR